MEGISHIAVDGFDVWCLEDGTHTFDAATFPGCAFEEQQMRLSAAGETEIRTVFNAYLIRDEAGVLTLVDAGCGQSFGGKGGAVVAHLGALGVTPADIKRLIFTHLHADHCGGALRDGQAVFPNAAVVLHLAEQAYWADQDAPGRQVLNLYADRLTLAQDGAAVAPGLTFWALPGHTPGHTGLRIGSTLVLVADILHSEVLQIGDPRLCASFDMDQPQAIESRLAALSEVADQGLIWSGSHMLGPEKFARLVQIGDGFIRIGL